MHQRLRTLAIAAVLTFSPAVTLLASAERFERHGDDWHYDDRRAGDGPRVQLGPRPFYLVDQMSPSRLKNRLQECAERPSFSQSDFSIGHRGGAPLLIPEHTRESHEAGARMGAGILECDVTFTNDGALVCRHDQCDLHTTTNILVTPLAEKCSRGFTPAEFDATGARTKAATALCCTSDLSLAEFKTLVGKMDASNPNARTPQEFLGGTPDFRTDLYATGATLLSHKESIRLIQSLGAKFTPELKGPNRAARLQVEQVFGSQERYAQAMIDDYKAARISPRDVFAQSFNYDDILYWIQHEPRFGRQAVFLDDANVPAELPSLVELQGYAAQGVKIVAPPMWALLTVDAQNNIVPSQYARNARAAGLDIITWTIERSGRIVEDVLQGGNIFYYQTTLPALQNDGDIMVTLDVLARQVGILGIFSDWAATVTYYANCMGLR
ncbi:MAG: glycerophosphodiester phosphodiesterase family protein [Candidatus Tectimicrobiota bacterium]